MHRAAELSVLTPYAALSEYDIGTAHTRLTHTNMYSLFCSRNDGLRNLLY